MVSERKSSYLFGGVSVGAYILSISSKQFADYFSAINDPDDRFFQVDDDILVFNKRNRRI